MGPHGTPRTWGHPRFLELRFLKRQGDAGGGGMEPHALTSASCAPLTPDPLTTSASIALLGWVAADDTLRLAVHLRVRNGRCRCPAAASHTLALSDPRRTYARYGGAWHCDECGKT